MADYSLSVEVNGSDDSYRRMLKSAQEATNSFAKNISNVGGSITSAGESLKSIGNDMTSLGKSATLVTAPVTALTASLVMTGVEYKAFKQNSEQAFSVLLGSAEAAKSHMNDIMDFAKTTPFAFPDLVSSNRQLVAFGMQAEKTHPVMEAIANAVAAMGGSGEDIAQLSDIFARIQSQGKITTLEINRLSASGVNALAILANEAGVSADEMRKQISAGAIGSEQAIDSLVEGIMNGSEGIAGSTVAMGGSLNALEGTFDGAVDKMKGAWRRLGDEIISDDSFDSIVAGINEITKVIGEMGPIIKPFAEEVGKLLSSLAQKISDLVKWFQNLNPQTQQSIMKFTALAAAAGPVLIILGKLTSSAGTVVSGFGKMVSKTGELIGKFTGLTKSTSESTGVLSKIIPYLSTHPYAALGVAIGGVALAVGGLIYQENAWKREHQKTVEALEQEKVKREELSQTMKDQVDAGTLEINNYQKLAEELDRIVDENGRVKAGYEERAETITGILSEALGVEMSLQDGVIDKYKETRVAIDDLIAAKKAEIAADILNDQYKQNLETQKEYNEKIKEYRQEKYDLEQKYAGLEEELENTIHDGKRTRIIEEMDKTKQQIGNKQWYIDETQRLLSQSVLDQKEYDSIMADLLSGETERIDTAMSKITNAYDERGDSIKSTLDREREDLETHLNFVREAYETNSTDVNRIALEDAEEAVRIHERKMQTELDTVYEYLPQLVDANGQVNEEVLAKIKEYDPDFKLDSETKQQLIKDGITENQTNIIGAVLNLTNEELKVLLSKNPDFLRAGDQNIEEYINGIREGENSSKEAANKVVIAGTNELADVSHFYSSKSSGKNFAEGFKDGISSMIGEVEKMASSLAQAAANSINSTLDIHSPSRVTAQSGRFGGEGFIIGFSKSIKEGIPQIKSTVQEAMDVIKDMDYGAKVDIETRAIGGQSASLAAQSMAQRTGINLTSANNTSNITNNVTNNFTGANVNPLDVYLNTQRALRGMAYR